MIRDEAEEFLPGRHLDPLATLAAAELDLGRVDGAPVGQGARVVPAGAEDRADTVSRRAGSMTRPPVVAASRSKKYGETTLWYGRRS